jgi:integrase
MAALNWYEGRKCWRVCYALRLRNRKARRAKYTRVKAEASVLLTQLTRVEQATRTGMATQQEIEEWVERGWLDHEQAAIAFAGYSESTQRKRSLHPATTDFERILEAYADHAGRTCKGGALGRNHDKNMSQARQVIAWLRKECSNLAELTPDGVRAQLYRMKEQYTESSVRQFLIKTHLLLDQAVAMGMIAQNPARQVRLRQDLNMRMKAARERRILSEQEIQHLLAICGKYPGYLNGGLPTMVHLGLYAGLRNEEMCWLKWGSIDWDRRIVTVQESVCEQTGESWVPKDYEARRIDVKPACIDYLAQERLRQEAEEILGPFALLGGKRPAASSGERAKPVHPDTPSKAFAKMIRDDQWDQTITVYSMRHTYATMALRSGVDLRTLQKRMGHSDLKTTMEYLHYIEPEEHPMDKLPY